MLPLGWGHVLRALSLVYLLGILSQLAATWLAVGAGLPLLALAAVRIRIAEGTNLQETEGNMMDLINRARARALASRSIGRRIEGIRRVEGGGEIRRVEGGGEIRRVEGGGEIRRAAASARSADTPTM